MFSSNTSQVASGAAVFVEDVFSTTLYQGTNSYRGLFLGVPNLAERGALFWFKSRNSATDGDNKIYYTDGMSDGGSFLLGSPSLATNITGFNNSGTSLRVIKNRTDGYVELSGSGGPNESSVDYAAWTFRKQARFFDVVTYTGNGSNPRDIAHSLGSVPGCVIIKRTDSTGDWGVWHRGSGATNGAITNFSLNTTDAAQWTSEPQTTMTSTTFQASAVRSYGAASGMNVNGAQYVAYIFAHNAGGFGLTGTDNVISCGSYSPSAGASSTFVNLGWEPQWVLIKNTNISGNSFTGWGIFDNMRGVTTPGDDQFLLANISNAESNGAALSIPSYVDFNATGFTANATTLTGANGGGHTYIYIAIRRGPMRTPTSGSSVMELTAYTGDGASQRAIGSSVLTDMLLLSDRDTNSTSYATTYAHYVFDRLRGDSNSLATSRAAAAVSGWDNYIDLDRNTGWDTSSLTGVQQDYLNKSGTRYISRSFRRAPGFFDVVGYTGNGATLQDITHGLGVVPQLLICKSRGSSQDWFVQYQAPNGDITGLRLNTTEANLITGSNGHLSQSTFYAWNNGSFLQNNTNGQRYIAYLFASCPGVSRVGTFFNPGSDVNVDCGFSAGARFILAKNTTNTGDWFVWDTARGIGAGTDPSLQLNTANAEQSFDDISALSSGFTFRGANFGTGTWLFLAIA